MTAPFIVLPRPLWAGTVAFSLSATQQKILGFVFVLHGFAHAAIGIWAAESGRWWLIASLWELAMVGFIAAGLGALGLAGLRDIWRGLTALAASSSILLFLTSPQRVFLVGLGLDISMLVLVAYARPFQIAQSPAAGQKHAIRRLFGVILSWLLLVYVALVIATRLWSVQWGTTEAERALPLPGDRLVPVAHYRIDHGITINTPAEVVWPWVVQIGQDRGGFYSYSALENAVGAHVTNADHIVPEWQMPRVGDIVRSVPSDWMGGRFGADLGWRILELVPGHALVLEGWGAFALIPASDSTTRMLVRTRGAGIPSLTSIVASPFGLLVFEPAHLIMERRMLLGIKERAERSLERSVDGTFFVGQ